MYIVLSRKRILIIKVKKGKLYFSNRIQLVGKGKYKTCNGFKIIHDGMQYEKYMGKPGAS